MKLLGKLVDKMRIGVRLGGGFGLLLIFIAIEGAVTTLDMNKLADLTQKLYNHPFTVRSTALHVTVNVKEIEEARDELVSADNAEARNNAIVKLNDLFKSVYANIDVLFDRYLGDKQEIESLRMGVREWYEIINQEAIILQDETRKNTLQELDKQATTNHLTMKEVAQYLVNFANNSSDGLSLKVQDILNDGMVSLQQHHLPMKK